MDSLARAQLDAIRAVVALSRRLDVPVWLRGGWAMDFSLGRVTRPHADVDWFAEAERAPGLFTALRERGLST